MEKQELLITLREFRELVLIAISLALSIEVPLRVAFDIGWRPLFVYWEIFATLALSADVVLNFFTPFREHHHLVNDRRRIARRYLRGWFALDFLAALPLSGLAALCGASGPVAGLLGINRLVRIARMIPLSRSWHSRHLQTVHPSLVRLSLFLVMVSVFAHWTACGWIWIGGVSPGAHRIDTYIEALYWTITTLTTVGYGDITPHTNLQRIYTMLVMIAGVGSYGYLIANVASFLANMDTVRAAHVRKLDEISSFLRYRAIPSDLQKRVMEYYGHLWESDSGSGETQMLAELPEALRTEMALVMHRTLLRNVPLFRAASHALLREIVLLLRPVLMLPGTTFIKEGESGDCMFFISSGVVEIVSRDGRRVFDTLHDGDYVGELALVLDQPRSASVRAAEYCDLYVLNKADFQRVLSNHPEFKSHIDATVERRMRRIRQRES